MIVGMVEGYVRTGVHGTCPWKTKVLLPSFVYSRTRQPMGLMRQRKTKNTNVFGGCLQVRPSSKLCGQCSTATVH